MGKYEDLIKRLRDAAKMSEALAVLLPHSEGNATTKLYNEAADAIEAQDRHILTLQHEMMAEAESHIAEVNRLNKRIEVLSKKEKTTRWIPVTERLPEIDEKHHCSKDVLAYLKDGGMCFTALEENIFGQSCFECERNPAVEEEMIVTHWMPLPEPPKEESNGV